MGTWTTASARVYMNWKQGAGNRRVYIRGNNGFTGGLTVASGIQAISGITCYHDGLFEGDISVDSWLNVTTGINIGVLDITGTLLAYFPGNVQAVGIWPGVFTAPQVADVSAAMAAL